LKAANDIIAQDDIIQKVQDYRPPSESTALTGANRAEEIE
jgi:hypothetical protein